MIVLYSPSPCHPFEKARRHLLYRKKTWHIVDSKRRIIFSDERQAEKKDERSERGLIELSWKVRWERNRERVRERVLFFPDLKIDHNRCPCTVERKSENRSVGGLSVWDTSCWRLIIIAVDSSRGTTRGMVWMAACLYRWRHRRSEESAQQWGHLHILSANQMTGSRIGNRESNRE